MVALFRSLLLSLIIAALAIPVFAAQHTVTVQNFSFSPANITIAHGDTVVWNCTGGFHNVHHTANPSLFGNALASAPWTYTYVFDHIGDSTFHYICQQHAQQMQGTVTVEGVSEVSDPISGYPGEFALEQNYPNPFNPTTEIRFSLPMSGEASLRVFDMLGQEVATLVNGYTETGNHTATFDAGGLPSGIYFARLNAAGFSQTRKLTLLK